MIILAIDYGAQRTGLAVCDPMGILASPVGVLQESNRKKLVAAVARAAREQRAELLLVGLPLRTDGTKGEKALACELFARELEQASGLPAQLWDERFTTVAAHQALHAAHRREKSHKSVVDAVAAVILLQSYLDRK
ncbi:MAG: Holliday junction resolvase RuvX [Oscillospiraceae bacterium]|jgi:putative Holliday junction resolvase|nr:Holliday junction resolvase RuvX [Oscillospiraceae bacterium]